MTDRIRGRVKESLHPLLNRVPESAVAAVGVDDALDTLSVVGADAAAPTLGGHHAVANKRRRAPRTRVLGRTPGRARAPVWVMASSRASS